MERFGPLSGKWTSSAGSTKLFSNSADSLILKSHYRVIYTGQNKSRLRPT
jgi:hypothetical protein